MPTVIVGVIVCFAVFFAVKKMWQDRKNGCGGCGGCSGCSTNKCSKNKRL